MWVRLKKEAVCWDKETKPTGLGTRSIADTVGRRTFNGGPVPTLLRKRSMDIREIRWEEESEVNKLRDGIDRGYRWENKLLKEIECRLA